MMSAERHVFVVDDDEPIRSSLRVILSPAYKVQTFETPSQFLAGLPTVDLAVVVVDYEFGLHEMNGLELQRHLVDNNVPHPVIIVTGYAQTDMTVAAMKNGAVDFLEKPYSEKALVAAIEAAFETAEIALARHQEMAEIQSRLDLLDEEERLVLECLLEGLANKQIASRQDVALRTVERRRRSLLDKLDVETVQEAAIMVTKIHR